MALPRIHKVVNLFARPSSWIIGLRPRLPQTGSSACICSLKMMDPTIVKPEPWPYETKKFTVLHAYFQSTESRFDENTKIISVEGNIGAGKTAFAKQLAEEFGMKYIPEPTMDQFYINSYGYDLRQLDPIVPPSYKSCDMKTFYTNPHHQNVAKLQFRMFQMRLEQYIDALAHLLNTGQGIVLDRCVYSDFVFMESMYDAGYVGVAARDLYNEITASCIKELMRPSLIVYLDISVDTALERIKQRNIPHEVNSKVLNADYLGSLEYHYKQHFLRLHEKHAELLIYDWSNFGDVEVVVEDIERIDFDRFGKYDSKMSDWRREDDYEWSALRRKYTNNKLEVMQNMNLYRPAVTEVYHPPAETEEYGELLNKVPGEKYTAGFNPNLGDKVWFKSKHKGYRYLEQSYV